MSAQTSLSSGCSYLIFVSPFFSLDVIRDQVHRARAEKREDGDDVVDSPDVELPAHAGHAAAFQLEDPHRLAAVEQGDGSFIVEGNGFQIEPRFAHVDEFDGVLDEREGLQTQEIHLQQAEIVQRTARVLGDDLLPLVPGERDVFVEIPVADDDAGRVHPRVAGEALEDERVVPHLPRGGFGLDGLFQLGVFLGGRRERQGLGGLDGDHLGKPVAVTVTHCPGPGRRP